MSAIFPGGGRRPLPKPNRAARRLREDAERAARANSAATGAVAEDVEQVEQDVSEITPITTYRQAVAPGGELYAGDLWFDTDDTNKAYRWDGAAWVTVRDDDIGKALLDAYDAYNLAEGKNTLTMDGVAPVEPVGGDIWIDTSDGNKLYVWSGTAWVNAEDDRLPTALADAQQALIDADAAQSTADSKIVTFYQSAEPTGAAAGDLWLDDTKKLWRYSGTGWVQLQDTDIAKAISDAKTAQNTADGKIVTFYQALAPTAEADGDLWVDTDDGNRLYRWDESLATPDWVDVHDTAIDKAQTDASKAITDAANAQTTAEGKVTTFYQSRDVDGEPVAEAAGDLWIDTDHDRLYRWDGAAWVEVKDEEITTAINNAKTAQSTADSKIVSFYQATAPTADGFGDLWVDTDDGNKLHRWDGTSWNAVPFKSGALDISVGGGNLVPNSSFEDGTNRWGAVRSSATADTSVQRTGDASAKVVADGTAGSAYFITDHIPFTDEGAVVTASIHARRDGANTGSTTVRLQVQWRMFDGTSYTYQTDVSDFVDPGTDGWKRLVITSRPAPANVVSVRIYPLLGGTPAAGDAFWFEDAQLEEGDVVTGWKPKAGTAEDTDKALVDAQKGIDDAYAAQVTADGKIETFYSSTAPTASGVGDLWLDTSLDAQGNPKNLLHRWDGAAWVPVQDQEVKDAIADAGDAQATADGKITTYYFDSVNGEPVAEGDGDLWVDTGQKNRLKRWDATLATPAWVDVHDTAIDDAQSAADGAQGSANEANATLDTWAYDGTRVAISGGKIQAGTVLAKQLAALAIEVGKHIESSNYSATAGSEAGWHIDGDGNATFNNASLRGELHTGAPTSQGIDVVGNDITFRDTGGGQAVKIVTDGSYECRIYGNDAFSFMPDGRAYTSPLLYVGGGKVSAGGELHVDGTTYLGNTMVLRGSAPRIIYRDSAYGTGDNIGAWWHYTNGDNFYLLTERHISDAGWDTPHPYRYNRANNHTYIGGSLGTSGNYINAGEYRANNNVVIRLVGNDTVLGASGDATNLHGGDYGASRRAQGDVGEHLYLSSDNTMVSYVGSNSYEGRYLQQLIVETYEHMFLRNGAAAFKWLAGSAQLQSRNNGNSAYGYLRGVILDESDPLYKRDVATLTNARTIVDSAPAYRYRQVGTEGEVRAGVMTTDLPDWLVRPDQRGTDGIDLYAMVGVLWGAVRELSSEVERMGGAPRRDGSIERRKARIRERLDAYAAGQTPRLEHEVRSDEEWDDDLQVATIRQRIRESDPAALAAGLGRPLHGWLQPEETPEASAARDRRNYLRQVAARRRKAKGGNERWSRYLDQQYDPLVEELAEIEPDHYALQPPQGEEA